VVDCSDSQKTFSLQKKKSSRNFHLGLPNFPSLL
jgi:hypothetical protein